MTDIERCRREVEELHAFFVDWLSGKAPRSDESFARLQRALADDFELVSREGHVYERSELIGILLESHASESGFTLRIWIEDLRVRSLGDGTYLVTYEEWQDRRTGTNGRRSSAVFRDEADSPNGLQWLHVHESALSR